MRLEGNPASENACAKARPYGISQPRKGFACQAAGSSVRSRYSSSAVRCAWSSTSSKRCNSCCVRVMVLNKNRYSFVNSCIVSCILSFCICQDHKILWFLSWLYHTRFEAGRMSNGVEQKKLTKSTEFVKYVRKFCGKRRRTAPSLGFCQPIFAFDALELLQHRLRAEPEKQRCRCRVDQIEGKTGQIIRLQNGKAQIRLV